MDTYNAVLDSNIPTHKINSKEECMLNQ